MPIAPGGGSASQYAPPTRERFPMRALAAWPRAGGRRHGATTAGANGHEQEAANEEATGRGGRRTMPEAGARSIFAVGGGREAGSGGAERNRRPPDRGACSGRRMRVITSLESCWRGGCMPQGTCDCVVMLPRVFPEGTSGEGGTRLREAPGPRCSITPRTSHGPEG